MKVIWSRRALLDVKHIRDYIAQDSPAYAQPFVERLLTLPATYQSFRTAVGRCRKPRTSASGK
jgi:plasmid stabilization system protein ParE